MNTEVHDSIGVSPYELLYGNAIQHQPHVLLPQGDVTKLSDHAADMLLKQASIITLAAENQRKKDDKHNSEWTNPLSEFGTNSYVLVTYPEGPPTKLHPVQKGPLRVVENIGPNYKLLNLVTNKIESHHATRLRKFTYDESNIDPRLIATRDSQVTDVEAIIKHNGDKNGKPSDLDFLVKWVGLDDSHNLWLPWKELSNNPLLHAYLRDNGMSRLVPRRHR